MKEFILSRPLPCIICAVMLIMSPVLFTAMAVDKRRAVKKRFRISEARLFLLAVLGGAWGGWAGMYVFHHKTKHMKFVILFPLIAFIQLAGLIYLFII